MIEFLRRHVLLSLAFFVTFLITLMFLIRFTFSTLMWFDPDNLEQPIAGWMTPRYIAKSWQVEPEVVAGALGLEMDSAGRRVTVKKIAATQGWNLDDLILDLESAIKTALDSSND